MQTQPYSTMRQLREDFTITMAQRQLSLTFPQHMRSQSTDTEFGQNVTAKFRSDKFLAPHGV